MKLLLMTLLPRLERNNNFIGKAYSSTINFKLSNTFTNIKIHHKTKKPSEIKFWFKAEYIYIYIYIYILGVLNLLTKKIIRSFYGG